MNPHLIAYSPDHDGLCAIDRDVSFYEANGEAQPPFTRYKLSWTDALGCRHLVRYDLELREDAPTPIKSLGRDTHYKPKAA